MPYRARVFQHRSDMRNRCNMILVTTETYNHFFSFSSICTHGIVPRPVSYNIGTKVSVVAGPTNPPPNRRSSIGGVCMIT